MTEFEKKIMPGVIMLALSTMLTACVTNDSDIAIDSPPVSAVNAVQLNGQQIRQRLIGNTIIGDTDHFKKHVGTISFQIHYAADGTAKDYFSFTKAWSHPDVGIWRITDEEHGLFCNQFHARQAGNESCYRVFVREENQFRLEPANKTALPLNGEILSGDRVQPR